MTLEFITPSISMDDFKIDDFWWIILDNKTKKVKINALLSKRSLNYQ